MSPLIEIRARVASTHPNSKYPGYAFGEPVMRHMARELEAGRLPMIFDHDPSHPVAARVLDAEVVPLEDGHFAVEITFEVEEAEWQTIQDRFDAAGVAGGFSFTGTVPDRSSSRRRPGLVTLAVDAAAWTDAEREEARALLDTAEPTDSALLFQLSAVQEIATVFLILGGQVGMSILGNAAYDAIKSLVLAHAPRGRTRIEVHRTAPDGTTVKAVTVTDDPDVAQRALESLPKEQSQPFIGFDDGSWNWPEG